MTTLNAYTISWAILTPVKGKITKKDLNILAKCGIWTLSSRKEFNQFFFHAKTKETAIQQLKKVKGLSRNYEVVIITDKQFGDSKWNESLLNVATKKQLQNRFFI